MIRKHFDRVTRAAMAGVGAVLVGIGLLAVMVAAVPIIIGGLLLGWEFYAERTDE